MAVQLHAGGPEAQKKEGRTSAYEHGNEAAAVNAREAHEVAWLADLKEKAAKGLAIRVANKKAKGADLGGAVMAVQPGEAKRLRSRNTEAGNCAPEGAELRMSPRATADSREATARVNGIAHFATPCDGKLTVVAMQPQHVITNSGTATALCVGSSTAASAPTATPDHTPSGRRWGVIESRRGFGSSIYRDRYTKRKLAMARGLGAPRFILHKTAGRQRPLQWSKANDRKARKLRHEKEQRKINAITCAVDLKKITEEQTGHKGCCWTPVRKQKFCEVIKFGGEEGGIISYQVNALRLLRQSR
jgi:hypothetical protein